MQALAILPFLGKGLLLGWSVAWPPGPINSEMIRRGLSRGFWPAYSVGLGACSGDFLWAVGVSLGAGALARIPAVYFARAAISFVLLLVLAVTFTRNLRGWRALQAGQEIARPATRLDGSRGGYLLGIGMALSSPWNIAFWLAVVGQQARVELGLASTFLFAASVVAGAAIWGFFLCTAVRLGARFASPRWEIATNALTALLMLYFALELLNTGALLAVLG
jgi:threonine/homoserine/homoserine lactone efflux protein